VVNQENDANSDVFLSTVVYLVERAVLSNQLITLFVGGLIITGKIVSMEEYFRQYSVALVSHTGGENIISEQIDKITSAITDNPKVILSNIHIKNPQIIGGEQSMSFQGSQHPYLRIKLSAIDGFLFGGSEINPSE
jgi:hypothetical protein